MSNGSNINPNFVINLWFKYYVLLFLWLIAHPFSDFKCASLGSKKTFEFQNEYSQNV